MKTAQPKSSGLKDKKATKTPPPGAGQSCAFVWGENWEIWHAHSATPTLLPENQTPPPQEKISSLALPTRYLQTAAVWMIQSDRATLRDTLLIELERRDLIHPKHPVDSLDFRIIAQEGNRCLVSACFLKTPPEWLAAFHKIKTFTTTADLFPLPANQFILWKEGKDTILAVTRERDICHLELLPGYENPAALASDLLTLRLRLESDNIIQTLTGITFWYPVPESSLEPLSRLLNIPAVTASRPAPQLQEKHWKLTPTLIARQQAASAQNSQIQKWIAVAVFFYLVLATFYVSQYFYLQSQVKALRVRRDVALKQVEEFKKTAQLWNTLRPAFDSREFILEQLLHVRQTLPENTRLTQFEVTPQKARIRGEAQSARIAFIFFENLKADPALKGWNWTMQEPKVLPSNMAEFQVEGKK